MIGLVIVLPVLVQGLPASWQVAVTRYLPPFGAYACITLIIAAVTLNRRDA